MSEPSQQDPEAAIRVALAEYQAMYGLIVFRMTSLDRRAHMTVLVFTTVLGSLAVLPNELRVVLLLGLPPATLWFLKTTSNHVRSFEDALRRAEHLEKTLNRLCRQEIMGFQSSHPSRPSSVGGRTGQTTIRAVLVAVLLLQVACGFLMTTLLDVSALAASSYHAFLACISIGLVHEVHQLGKYAYGNQTTKPLISP